MSNGETDPNEDVEVFFGPVMHRVAITRRDSYKPIRELVVYQAYRLNGSYYFLIGTLEGIYLSDELPDINQIIAEYRGEKREVVSYAEWSVPGFEPRFGRIVLKLT